MLYKNIREFISLAHECPFCHESLNVGFCPKSNNKNLYNSTGIGFINFTSNTFSSLKGNLYQSDVVDNKLTLYLMFNNCYNKIFSIDLDTNIISGTSIENAQRVIFNNELVIVRRCTSESCARARFMFAHQSSLVVFGTKSNKLYPFTNEVEVVTLVINGQKLTLISSREQNSTYLLNNRNIITKLPKLDLHLMLNEELLVKKIKTYILFS